MSDRNEIQTSGENLKTMALGGNSTLTIERSNGERRHVTLKITKGKREGAPYFVSVLTGSDNENRDHYSYVGCIWTTDRGDEIAPRFTTTAKSRLPRDDARVEAIADLVSVINDENEYDETVTIWHEGRCCFCGKKLTQPESVDRGYGPSCAAARGLPYGATSKPLRSTSTGTSPRRVSALDVECPVARCGALEGERCNRPSQTTGRQNKSDEPHKVRFNRAEKAACAAVEPTTVNADPRSFDFGHNAHSSQTIKAIDPIDARVEELTAQGWTDEDAARKQAKHEADGFTRWETSHGLPSAAIKDSEGREYDLVDLDEDDDEVAA